MFKTEIKQQQNNRNKHGNTEIIRYIQCVNFNEGRSFEDMRFKMFQRSQNFNQLKFSGNPVYYNQY